MIVVLTAEAESDLKEIGDCIMTNWRCSQIRV